MKLNELKSILQEFNISPKKSKGQNFLFDNNILNKIVEKSDIKDKDNILEIGPGLGVLTEKLTQKAKKVVAIELDKKIFQFLQKKFEGNENLILINKDILKISDEELKELFDGKEYKIVANIPYSITSRLIRVFLEREYKPADMILMMQKEVGDRILQKAPNSNVLALSCQLFSDPKILFQVKKTSFFPAPKVDSVVVKFDQIKVKNQINSAKIMKLIKSGFANKRKKLIKNIASFVKMDILKKLFEKRGWSENIRAQELTLDDWIYLSQNLK